MTSLTRVSIYTSKIYRIEFEERICIPQNLYNIVLASQSVPFHWISYLFDAIGDPVLKRHIGHYFQDFRKTRERCFFGLNKNFLSIYMFLNNTRKNFS